MTRCERCGQSTEGSRWLSRCASCVGEAEAHPPKRWRERHPYVEHDGGSFVVAGTKVVVRRLWAWHRGGTAVETLMRRYPNLGPAKVLGALGWAYDNIEAVNAEIEREQLLFSKRHGAP